MTVYDTSEAQWILDRHRGHFDKATTAWKNLCEELHSALADVDGFDSSLTQMGIRIEEDAADGGSWSTRFEMVNGALVRTKHSGAPLELRQLRYSGTGDKWVSGDQEGDALVALTRAIVSS